MDLDLPSEQNWLKPKWYISWDNFPYVFIKGEPSDTVPWRYFIKTIVNKQCLLRGIFLYSTGSQMFVYIKNHLGKLAQMQKSIGLSLRCSSL